jgi:hypothetical protein
MKLFNMLEHVGDPNKKRFFFITTNIASCVDRAQRLKAAKTDAATEVEAYKKEKEAEFQASEAKVGANSLCYINRVYIF